MAACLARLTNPVEVAVLAREVVVSEVLGLVELETHALQGLVAFKHDVPFDRDHTSRNDRELREGSLHISQEPFLRQLLLIHHHLVFFIAIKHQGVEERSCDYELERGDVPLGDRVSFLCLDLFYDLQQVREVLILLHMDVIQPQIVLALNHH
eukprot:CAMPEP_0170546176 /NCGR_PEP_ID=MMETSP0211-20121228/4552_1 /TAXON_ID=311385 /ORGANISM="Pseudokeronopsis sp., Strain OXSARD2" /LENGTH=152 /DNA_ID=CAMNT_0010850511 /DNA_START=153 /DNA_END=614 /DNA_ORIENTATION=-